MGKVRFSPIPKLHSKAPSRHGSSERALPSTAFSKHTWHGCHLCLKSFLHAIVNSTTLTFPSCPFHIWFLLFHQLSDLDPKASSFCVPVLPPSPIAHRYLRQVLTAQMISSGVLSLTAGDTQRSGPQNSKGKRKTKLKLIWGPSAALLPN